MKLQSLKMFKTTKDTFYKQFECFFVFFLRIDKANYGASWTLSFNLEEWFNVSCLIYLRMLREYVLATIVMHSDLNQEKSEKEISARYISFDFQKLLKNGKSYFHFWESHQMIDCTIVISITMPIFFLSFFTLIICLGKIVIFSKTR